MKKKNEGKRKLVLKKTSVVSLQTNGNVQAQNGTIHCEHPTTTVQHTFGVC